MSIRLWDPIAGDLLSSAVATRDGEWLAISPDGSFAASRKGTEQTLSVVRGLEVTTIGQVHQSLFNSDLVHACHAISTTFQSLQGTVRLFYASRQNFFGGPHGIVAHNWSLIFRTQYSSYQLHILRMAASAAEPR